MSSHLFEHGRVSYLQIPATNVRESSEFYANVFGWKSSGDRTDHLSFTDTANGMIGHWVTNLPVSKEPGIIPYIYVHSVDKTLELITANKCQIVRPKYPEGDVWVATFRDPAGNLIGIWQMEQRQQ